MMRPCRDHLQMLTPARAAGGRDTAEPDGAMGLRRGEGRSRLRSTAGLPRA